MDTGFWSSVDFTGQHSKFRGHTMSGVASGRVALSQPLGCGSGSAISSFRGLCTPPWAPFQAGLAPFPWNC